MRRVFNFVVADGAIAVVTLLEGAQTAVDKLPQRLESYLSDVVRPSGLAALRTEVDWKTSNTQAAAEAAMRRLALDYVTGYLEGGNARNS